MLEAGLVSLVLALTHAALFWRLWTPIAGAARTLDVVLAPALVPFHPAAFVVHGWIAGLGAYLWARRRGPPCTAGAAAAIASFALIAAADGPVALGAAWLPWLFAALEVFLERRTAVRAAIVVLAAAAVVCAGFPLAGVDVPRGLPIAGIGAVALAAAATALVAGPRSWLLGAGFVAAFVLERPSLAVILGAGLAAEGLVLAPAHPRVARAIVAVAVALSVVAAAVAAWLATAPNRAEPLRDLVMLFAALLSVAAWTLWQVTHDRQRTFSAISAAVILAELWFSHYPRLERLSRRRPAIAQAASTTSVASSTITSAR